MVVFLFLIDGAYIIEVFVSALSCNGSIILLSTINKTSSQ